MAAERRFNNIVYYEDRIQQKMTPTKIYFRSPTSFRQISESKDKQKPMFGKLKAKRLQESEPSSATKPVNLFSKLIESREHSAKKQFHFLEQTKVSTNNNSITANSRPIIRDCNKENKKPKGLQFKNFPHKKLAKINSDGPIKFSSKSPKSSMINPSTKIEIQSPFIGSNKKQKPMIPETERSPCAFIKTKNIEAIPKQRQNNQFTERLIETISIESSIQNSVVRSQSSLSFDMSPTLP